MSWGGCAFHLNPEADIGLLGVFPIKYNYISITLVAIGLTYLLCFAFQQHDTSYQH